MEKDQAGFAARRGIANVPASVGAAWILTVPLAILAFSPLGWWFLVAGAGGLINPGTHTGAAWLPVVIGQPLILWLLWKRRYRVAGVVLLLLAPAWVSTAWNPHTGSFTEWQLVIAVISLVIGTALVLRPPVRQDMT